MDESAEAVDLIMVVQRDHREETQHPRHLGR